MSNTAVAHSGPVRSHDRSLMGPSSVKGRRTDNHGCSVLLCVHHPRTTLSTTLADDAYVCAHTGSEEVAAKFPPAFGASFVRMTSIRTTTLSPTSTFASAHARRPRSIGKSWCVSWSQCRPGPLARGLLPGAIAREDCGLRCLQEGLSLWH